MASFPPQPTPFVGRAQALADVGARLANPECRLLTITGTGGSGKTRLALEAAQAASAFFPDGAVFVALQPLTDSGLLVPSIARALGMTFYGKDDPQAQLLSYLRERSLLLLLDNFEHLLAGTSLLSALLADAAGIKLLVTSREALDLQEEWLYPLKGMDTPPSIYSTALEDYEAVQLFLYHARRMQPGFDLASEREAVIRICQVAEGLPLAIELAASWLKGLSAGQIAVEMQRGIDFLATTARNVEERHRSIRAAFDQSWKLLSENERRTFARLSVFRGGFDRDAAQHVAGASLPLLVALVEKSLLQTQASGRFSLHELLRQYSEEQLELSGDILAARDLHSQYYADFTHERELDLKGRRQIEGLEAMDADFQNVRVAWDWALQTQAHGHIQRMIDGLFWYGIIRARQYDVNVMWQQVLAQTGQDWAYAQARIAVRQSYLLPYDSPSPAIVERLDRSLPVIQQHGDSTEIAIGQALLGLFLGGVAQHDFVRALQCARDSAAYFESSGDRFYLAISLHAFAWAYYYQGMRPKAMQYAQECAQLRREIGDRYGAARVLLLIAAEAYSIPDYEKSERFNREVLHIWRELRSWNLVSFVNGNLAYLAIFRGDFEAAKLLLDEGLRLAREVGIPDTIAYSLALSGVLASLEEHYTDAWDILMQAQAMASFTSSIEALEWGLPLAACGLGDYETARAANLHALQFSHRLNAPGRYFWHLPAACALLAHSGHTARAAELLGLIFTHPASAPAWMERWGLLIRLRADLETTLGATAYQAAWERGETLDLKTVVGEMIAWLGGQAEPTRTEMVDPLTPREIDVLRLLAAGLTNPQIAEQLVIGIGTVKTHTLNIYRKLDVANRTQAIVRARELGLLG